MRDELKSHSLTHMILSASSGVGILIGLKVNVTTFLNTVLSILSAFAETAPSDSAQHEVNRMPIFSL